MKRILFFIFMSMILLLSVCACTDKDAPDKPEPPVVDKQEYVNYFTDGMKWVSSVGGTPIIGEGKGPWKEEVWIDGSIDIDGVSALNLYRYNRNSDKSPRLIGYLRVEDDKVLYMNTRQGAEWNTFYDFGLTPGDVCPIELTHIDWYDMEYLIENLNISNTCIKNVKCSSLAKSKNEQGFYEMTVGLADEEGEVWLKGLGSLSGPLNNYLYSVLGYHSTLVEASLNGEVIYRNPEANIE